MILRPSDTNLSFDYKRVLDDCISIMSNNDKIECIELYMGNSTLDMEIMYYIYSKKLKYMISNPGDYYIVHIHRVKEED